MTSLILVLALSQPLLAQSTNGKGAVASISDQNRIDAIDQSVQALQSGKPHFTSTPTFSCLAFGDGTSQCTAAAVLNSTQTFTAPQVFSSTLTVTYLNEQWQNNSPGNNASTGVRCKIFQTTVISSGTAITYTSDATNGDKWTINQDGLYSIHLLAYANATDEMGISQNNQSCTTGIDSLANANVLCRNGTAIISGSDLVDCSFTGWLRAGNILHVHQGGATSISGSGNFVITRIY